MLVKYFPVVGWIKQYTYDDFANDTVAAIIVTIMLIPQSLAYALLAGLPPEIGLYASIIPLLLYSIFGTSKTLAVGPVGVTVDTVFITPLPTQTLKQSTIIRLQQQLQHQ